MLKPKTTYGSLKRMIGLGGFFSWMTLSALGLYFHVGEWFAACDEGVALTLATFWGLYTFLHIPFDFLGGFILPRIYDHFSPSFTSWLSKWSRGVLLHGVILWLSSMLIFSVASSWGTGAAVVWVALQMAFLVRFQFLLAQVFSPLTIDKVSRFPSDSERIENFRFLVVDSDDPAFTGGIMGAPGRESIVLPSNWKGRTSDDIFSVLRARRVGAILSGSRTRGLILAIIWNVVWFAVAAYFSAYPLSSIQGIIETSLWFTLFCGLGLLGGFLPFWSRRGSIELDNWTHLQGASELNIQKAISFTNAMQGDNPCQPQWLEKSVATHPSVENRLMHLFLNKQKRGAWHAVQNMLFLSWAGMGLVSRSVPCNLGHPDLWVIFPCD